MRRPWRLLLAGVWLLACAAQGGQGSPGPVGPGTDSGAGFDTRPVPTDRGTMVPTGDTSSVYDVGTADGAPVCDAGAPCSPRPEGCVGAEVPNNGLDDNCNGAVDEGSPCVPGMVQRCFRGPPGRRMVGACTDGMQTCQGAGEFGMWGPCMGGISPSAEVCDNLDDDCNGCVDEGLCCTSSGTCPAPGDPRIPRGAPFAAATLRGSMFGPGAMRYQWRVVGGPCDQLLFDTSMRVTYALNGAAGAMGGATLDAEGETLTFLPTLSGDYTVTLTMTFAGGRVLTCTFILPVRAPGFRAELCWPTTGRDDLDFWVHDPRNTNPFGVATNGDTCAYYNCRNMRSPFGTPINWGYADVPGTTCREPELGACHSPRLDLDNIATAGAPENINVDRPRPGDRFRVAVNYYGGSSMPSPMVNIYCGGELTSTFGGYDTRAGMHIGGPLVPRFTRSGQNASGTLWRVADVVMRSADQCTTRALHPRGSSAGYCVDTSTDRTFDGPCSVAP